ADVNQYYGFSILFNRTCRPRGDANCDHSNDFRDLSAFVLALLDPAAYAATYPSCNLVPAADLNGDGIVNGADIQQFINMLMNAAATGACCMANGPPYCEQQTAAYCAIVGGTYRGDGTTCATANCTGACCSPETDTCLNITGAACSQWGGTYHGDGSTCET